MLTHIVNSSLWQSQPTWKWERLFAVIYMTNVFWVTLLTIPMSSNEVAGQLLCTLGVLYTFAHMSVGARLEEAQDTVQKDEGAKKTCNRPSIQGWTKVECYAKLSQYLVMKEVFWLFGFAMLDAWSALAGIPLFLFYPAWRKAFLNARTRE